MCVEVIVCYTSVFETQCVTDIADLNVSSKLNFLDKHSTNDSYFCFVFLFFFIILSH